MLLLSSIVTNFLFLFLSISDEGLVEGLFAQCEYLDLTHSIRRHNPSVQPGGGFNFTRHEYQDKYTGERLKYDSYCADTRFGTHMNAPKESDGKRFKNLAEIDVTTLIGEGCVIKVADKLKDDKAYAVTEEDIEEWENEFGTLKDCIVLLYTGQSLNWGNTAMYTALDDRGKPQNPGFGVKAAHLLSEKGIKAAGIDAISIGSGHRDEQYQKVPAIFANKGIPTLENLRHIQRLPARKSMILALPIKIGDAAAAQARVIALDPTVCGNIPDSTSKILMPTKSATILSILLSMMTAFFYVRR